MTLSVIEMLFIVAISITGTVLLYPYGMRFFGGLLKGADSDPEVYMIINLRPLNKEKQKAYQNVAIPLAEKAGMEFLAAKEPVVLGGEWPYEGLLVIERFRSLSAVREYWDSEEYQAARELLRGADIRDFTVVVEAG